MLQRSFIHFPKIGQTAERRLWAKGVQSWSQLQPLLPTLYKENRLAEMELAVERAHQAYVARDLHYFYAALPRDQLWRLIPEAEDRIAYLDIESTGMGMPPLAESTTIAFYFRGQIYQEHETTRKYQLIRKMVDEADVWCTFFGEVFDVPFLRREFGLPIEKAHIDLCFWLKRLGYKGGLKRIQKLFPEIPSRESMDIDGYDAVRLWKMHRRGVPGALETLQTYNAEDTVVLEALLTLAFNLELQRSPEAAIGLDPRPLLATAAIPTRTHSEVYALLRGDLTLSRGGDWSSAV